jgi:hypothetical protein
MSALGHKRTCALQNGMSALHPIATVKADFRKGQYLLCPSNFIGVVPFALGGVMG